MWVMGQLCDGSHGSWVTKDDPFPSLLGLSVCDDFVILACVVFAQCQRVTDGCPDRQTDNRIVANTGLCIASYARRSVISWAIYCLTCVFLARLFSQLFNVYICGCLCVSVADDVVHEAEMRNLSHPNIVNFLAVTFEPGHYGLIFKYVKYGGLDDFLNNYDVSCTVGLLYDSRMKVAAVRYICY